MHENKNRQLHALVWKEQHLYVSKCVEVELASQGQTKREALDNLKEALELYFEDEAVALPVEWREDISLQAITPPLSI